MFAKIIRAFAYLYHIALALFLLGLAGVALTTSRSLNLEMLPWKGADLTQWLLWGSIGGLISVVLAVTGVFRFLFPVWALLVVVLMCRGFLLQPYSFGGKDPFYQVLALIIGAVIASLASLTLFKPRRRLRS